MTQLDSSKGRRELEQRRIAPLQVPTQLGSQASTDITGSMNALLADVFALYMKTKPMAERIRKCGGSALRSIGQIARTQRIKDNDAQYVDPFDMLAELCRTTSNSP